MGFVARAGVAADLFFGVGRESFYDSLLAKG
jgi:hypothetical protein